MYGHIVILKQCGRIIVVSEVFMNSKKHDLYGLVLAGGKSKRMGRDKAVIKWHGTEQQYYIADILKKFCDEVFISCRPEQAADIDKNYKTLPDTFLDLGQYGGILSALRHSHEQAWLVVACDLPLLNEKTLRFLVQHRNKKSIATTFESPFDDLPEPLITIWEPKSYQVLLSFLGKGFTCPRKALINSKPTILHAPDPDALMNVNTPADLEKAQKNLRIEHAI